MGEKALENKAFEDFREEREIRDRSIVGEVIREEGRLLEDGSDQGMFEGGRDRGL